MAMSEERLRILKLVESGQVTAEEGARLLDALSDDSRERARPEARPRSLRVIVTEISTRRQKIHVTIPAGLVSVGIKLGARFFPRNADISADDILRAVESGAPGRIFELQDLEEGERIEIYVE